jgi:hypothetical protein
MEDMSHVSGRAELTAAIDDQDDAIRHLTRGALRAMLTETACNTTDVERTLAGELAAAWASGNPEPQFTVAKAIEGPTEDQAATNIAPMTEDLPQDMGHAGIGESGIAGYLSPSSRTTIRTDCCDSKCKPSIRENVIAVGIAELQDRLGGFIKS